MMQLQGIAADDAIILAAASGPSRGRGTGFGTETRFVPRQGRERALARAAVRQGLPDRTALRSAANSPTSGRHSAAATAPMPAPMPLAYTSPIEVTRPTS